MDRLISEKAVLDILKNGKKYGEHYYSMSQLIEIIKAIPSAESSRDIEEMAEIINCDADAETKCKMISNILNAKPHYFEKQEPCKDAKAIPSVQDDDYVMIKRTTWKKIEKVLDSVSARGC